MGKMVTNAYPIHNPNFTLNFINTFSYAYIKHMRAILNTVLGTRKLQYTNQPLRYCCENLNPLLHILHTSFTRVLILGFIKYYTLGRIILFTISADLKIKLSPSQPTLNTLTAFV